MSSSACVHRMTPAGSLVQETSSSIQEAWQPAVAAGCRCGLALSTALVGCHVPTGRRAPCRCRRSWSSICRCRRQQRYCPRRGTLIVRAARSWSAAEGGGAGASSDVELIATTEDKNQRWGGSRLDMWPGDKLAGRSRRSGGDRPSRVLSPRPDCALNLDPGTTAAERPSWGLT